MAVRHLARYSLCKRKSESPLPQYKEGAVISSSDIPHSIMRRIQRNNMRRELQHAVAKLIRSHYSAQIRHRIFVLFCIGNGGQGVWSAIVLGKRIDVCPFLRACVARFRYWHFTDDYGGGSRGG